MAETGRPWRRQETGETLGWEKTGDRRQVSLSVSPGDCGAGDRRGGDWSLETGGEEGE